MLVGGRDGYREEVNHRCAGRDENDGQRTHSNAAIRSQARRWMQRDMLFREDDMVRNVNEKFGECIEFETVAEMAEAVEACGFELPEDGLIEHRDYETF